MKTEFKVRLNDAEIAKSIDELLATKMFSSANELLNKALGIGIEKIYLEFGKKKHFAAAEIPEQLPSIKVEEILRKTQELKVLEEDMFILLNSIEGLVASIYNVQRATIKGEALTEELLDSGSMASLPDAYNEIKEKLFERFTKNMRKGNRR